MSVFATRRRELMRKEADRTGYFQYPTRDVIVKETDVPTLDDVHLIQLRSRRFQSLGDVPLCVRITVCDLSNNYLTEFDALQSCIRLIYLDLHGNQIDKLPETDFWSKFHHLQVLYLHGNAFCDMSDVQNISSSRNLSILTLYNSPVALQPNYRHRVVNTVWSLKALDHFVIADEEIIEEAEFGGRFSAMTKNFKMDLYQPIPMGCSHQEAQQIVKQLVRRVNATYVYNSPIITIQKWARSWLARRHISPMLQQRCRAAARIQQAYRQYKRVTIPVADSDVNSPATLTAFPSYPTPDYEQYYRRRVQSGSSSYAHSLRSVAMSSERSARGKTARVSLRRLERNIKEKTRIDEVEMAAVSRSPCYFLAKVSPATRHKSKLLQQPSGDGQDELLVMAERKLVMVEGKKRHSTNLSMSSPRGSPRVRRLISPSSRGLQRVKSESDVELAVAARLPVILTMDPIEDVVTSRRRAGRDIRAAGKVADEIHSTFPKPNIKKSEPDANDHILMDRIQTMNLACLSAVDKAYQKRKKARDKEIKARQVKARHQAHCEAKQQNEARHHKKQEMLATQRVIDKKQLNFSRRESETARNRTREDVRMKRSSERQREEGGRQEATFVRDFHQQQSAVSQALVKHDVQTTRDEKVREAQTHVHDSREQSREQHEIVKAYMEHRQLRLAAQFSTEREFMNANKLKEVNQSLMEARKRVTRLRNQTEAITREVDALFPPSREASDCISISSRSTGNAIYRSLPDVRRKGKQSIVCLSSSKVRSDSTLTASL